MLDPSCLRLRYVMREQVKLHQGLLVNLWDQDLEVHPCLSTIYIYIYIYTYTYIS